MQMKVRNYKLIVAKFIDFIGEKNLEISNVQDIEDLLRNALCIGLKLQSSQGNLLYKDFYNECSYYLLCDLYTSKYTLVERQALLEACLQTFHRTMLVGGYL